MRRFVFLMLIVFVLSGTARAVDYDVIVTLNDPTKSLAGMALRDVGVLRSPAIIQVPSSGDIVAREGDVIIRHGSGWFNLTLAVTVPSGLTGECRILQPGESVMVQPTSTAPPTASVTLPHISQEPRLLPQGRKVYFGLAPLVTPLWLGLWALI
jgi:hypothetical protein